MSIKALAVELYKSQRKVHELQDKLETATPKEKDSLKYELKAAEAELLQLRRIMEGEKETAQTKKQFNLDYFSKR